jgi:large subunit ribosomal protein L25
MATVSLSANSRDSKGKGSARTLRSQGQIPAVIYGHGRDPQSLARNPRGLAK